VNSGKLELVASSSVVTDNRRSRELVTFLIAGHIHLVEGLIVLKSPFLGDRVNIARAGVVKNIGYRNTEVVWGK